MGTEVDRDFVRELVAWFRTRPASERRQHHAKAPTFGLAFGF